MTKEGNVRIPNLGDCRFESPLRAKGRTFVAEPVRVRFDPLIGAGLPEEEALSFEKAGPRERIFFDPDRTTAAFVTCGGLSPGLNNVIRSGFLELTYNYGVRRVLGIRHGYAGLHPDSGLEPIAMTQRFVHDIHHLDGPQGCVDHRHRLVGNDHPRMQEKGSGHHYPLSLAAAELVRVTA